MYYYLMVAVFILGLFLCFYYRLKPIQVLLFKTLTSMCFIALGIIAFNLNKDAKPYFNVMIIGLVFGLLGDVALGVKEVNIDNKAKWILLGITLFFIGHLFYIIAMSKFINNIYLYIVISLLLILLNILFTYILKFNFGVAKYLIYPYIIISSVILTITLINAIIDPNHFKLTVALGTIGFVGSDYVLSFLYFKDLNKHQKLIKRINLLLYYCGQFLLALSIFLY